VRKLFGSDAGKDDMLITCQSEVAGLGFDHVSSDLEETGFGS
jgi:hypothetical protein